MFHSAWKMAVSQISLSPLPPFTTITVHQEMPGFTKDVLEGLEELGVPGEVTKISGFSSILEDVLGLRVFARKVDRTLING